MKKYLVLLTLSAFSMMVWAVNKAVPQLAVTWNELGTDENCSMPLGNGDIAVNAWTEQNGDLVMLVAKTDAWSENAQLLKLGRVRLSLSPNPFVNAHDFKQTLTIGNATMMLKSGKNEVKVWVDANNPAIRVEARTEKKVKMSVKNELWRTTDTHLTQEQVNENLFNYWEWKSNPNGLDFLADTVLPASKGSTAWCHFNRHSMYGVVFDREHLGKLKEKYPDPLKNRCFGCMVEGIGMKAVGNSILESEKASFNHNVSIFALTEQTAGVDAWLQDIRQVASKTVPIGKAWNHHEKWWEDFWNRSYINLSGTDDARKVYEGYVVSRYMTACAGRGKYPIKFNGSLFTVGHDMPVGKISTTEEHDPDFRDWGSCYWNQNVRQSTILWLRRVTTIC